MLISPPPSRSISWPTRSIPNDRPDFSFLLSPICDWIEFAHPRGVFDHVSQSKWIAARVRRWLRNVPLVDFLVRRFLASYGVWKSSRDFCGLAEQLKGNAVKKKCGEMDLRRESDSYHVSSAFVFLWWRFWEEKMKRVSTSFNHLPLPMKPPSSSPCGNMLHISGQP